MRPRLDSAPDMHEREAVELFKACHTVLGYSHSSRTGTGRDVAYAVREWLREEIASPSGEEHKHILRTLLELLS